MLAKIRHTHKFYESKKLRTKYKILTQTLVNYLETKKYGTFLKKTFDQEDLKTKILSPY